MSLDIGSKQACLLLYGSAPTASSNCNKPGFYRDRAEERRKGLNPDYERTAMSGLPTDEALNPTMSVEETKYLGGDLEHTHLVKGLDYALLQKVSRGHAARSSLGVSVAGS